MHLIPLGTLQRETLQSSKWGVLPGAEEPGRPLQMFMDTQQRLYMMQTPLWSLSSTEKCPQSSRGCMLYEGVLPL